MFFSHHITYIDTLFFWFFSHRTFRWSESACRVKVPQQDRVRILGEAFGVGLKNGSGWSGLPDELPCSLPKWPQAVPLNCFRSTVRNWPRFSVFKGSRCIWYDAYEHMVLLSWMVWSCMCLPGCSIRTSESSWPSFLFPQSISGTPCSRDWQLVAKYVLGRIDDFIEKIAGLHGDVQKMIPFAI